MKIMYDHHIFSLQAYGGISRYIVEIVRNISSYKDKNLSLKINSPLHINNYLYENISKNYLYGLKISDFRASRRLCLMLNSILSPILSKFYNPDLIHQTYYSTNKFKYVKAKKILTVYDMIHEIFPDQFLKTDNTSKLKNISVSEADHIICISKKTQNDLVKLFNVDVKKTSVVYLGFSLTTKEIKHPNNIKRPYLLFVGNRSGYKNFLRFLEAYSSKIIKDTFDLVIFGGGQLTFKELEIMDNLKIPRNYVKQVSGSDSILAGYYKNAALFIYPTLYEGFGFPPLEAMSYGCPVICSNGGSIPEVVSDAALLFDPYSVNSIKEKIQKVMTNEKLQLLLINKGFERVKQFSWERCARETYEIYRKILD
jgi:glycosyltransferase involved in cell wall biosynthesis